MQYDLLIRGGRIVDPLNAVDMVGDIAFAGGTVARVAERIDPTGAREVYDVEGHLVVPGVIDSHVHLTYEGTSEGLAYNMLLRRGVTTALDMMGGIDLFLEEIKAMGHGLNGACLHSLIIGKDVATSAAGREEVAGAIDAVLERGAFGIKIMGGHYPFTPETTGYIIDECAKRRVYVAFHAGTTANGSNINGFLEAVDIADGRPLHMAHVNAYCRGQVEDPLLETGRLLRSLEQNPNIVSESYLSVMNGTSAEVDEAENVRSNITRTWLKHAGYSLDKRGMEKAIRDGWASIYARYGDELIYLTPQDGLAFWEKMKTDAWCSFPVNNPVAMLACATAKRKDGSFTVDAISTDGGSVPRNVIFENGIRLVQMRYLTMQDLVAKSSLNPARLLGLVNKGHLSPGADGDVAVFCPQEGKALYTVIGGKIRMAARACGEGPGVVVTREEGKKAVEKAGIPCQVPDFSQSTFLRGHPAA